MIKNLTQPKRSQICNKAPEGVENSRKYKID